MNHIQQHARDPLYAKMAQLGFITSRDRVDALIQHASASKASFMDLLEQFLQEEVSAKHAEQVAGWTRLARFPFVTGIEAFDFAFQPSIDREVIHTLASGDFVDQHHNVVLLGPTGVGKTHLAVGLGLKAIERGDDVLFTTMDDMIKVLARAAVKGKRRQKLEYYTRPRVLIIDDVCSARMDQSHASLFYDVVNGRYEHGSIILTSLLPFEDWGQVMNDQGIAAAILDRLLHHATVISIHGNSYRQRHKLTSASLPQMPGTA